MCLNALGGDGWSVVGSAGPDQTLGRKIGLCCSAEAAGPSLAPWCCVAALQSLFSLLTGCLNLCMVEAIFRISLEHFLGQTLFASASPARSYLGFLMLSLELVDLPHCLKDVAGGISKPGCCLARLMLGKPNLGLELSSGSATSVVKCQEVFISTRNLVGFI